MAVSSTPLFLFQSAAPPRPLRHWTSHSNLKEITVSFIYELQPLVEQSSGRQSPPFQALNWLYGPPQRAPATPQMHPPILPGWCPASWVGLSLPLFTFSPHLQYVPPVRGVSAQSHPSLKPLLCSRLSTSCPSTFTNHTSPCSSPPWTFGICGWQMPLDNDKPQQACSFHICWESPMC